MHVRGRSCTFQSIIFFFSFSQPPFYFRFLTFVGERYYQNCGLKLPKTSSSESSKISQDQSVDTNFRLHVLHTPLHWLPRVPILFSLWNGEIRLSPYAPTNRGTPESSPAASGVSLPTPTACSICDLFELNFIFVYNLLDVIVYLRNSKSDLGLDLEIKSNRVKLVVIVGSTFFFGEKIVCSTRFLKVLGINPKFSIV